MHLDVALLSKTLSVARSLYPKIAVLLQIGAKAAVPETL